MAEKDTLIRHCGLNMTERGKALQVEYPEPIPDAAVTPDKIRTIFKRHNITQQKMVWRLGKPKFVPEDILMAELQAIKDRIWQL